MVQILIPDVESNSNCEYNKLIDDDLTQNKQPFKLSHEETNTLKVAEILENICGEKYNFVSAICCTGNVTYINVNHPSLIFVLSNAAESNNFP